MAIKACLDIANLSIDDIDAIGIARDGKANLVEKAKFAIMNLGNMPQLAKQRLENRAKVKSAPELLASSLGIEARDGGEGRQVDVRRIACVG